MHYMESNKMLKMSSFETNRPTCTETFVPLINCKIGDALLETTLDIDHTTASIHRRNELLFGRSIAAFSPNFVVNWVQTLPVKPKGLVK